MTDGPDINAPTTSDTTPTAPAVPPTKWDELSKRENEVALMLAVGKTCREIAEWLFVSVKTIDTHRGHIMKKLGTRNNVELARMALREGRVSL